MRKPALQVQLDMYPWKKQRQVLPRPHEQAIQQRLGAIADYTSTAEEWLSWAEHGSGFLPVTIQFLDALKPAQLVGDRWGWSLELSMAVDDFVHLDVGPSVTLRLVQSVEAIVTQCQPHLSPVLPAFLGRTRREGTWLADGGIDPGPGTITALRVRKPAAPMPAEDLWSLIAATTSDTTGVHRLGWHQADRFTAGLRELIESLNTEENRHVADMVLGTVSDDVWEDTRVGVVTRGQEAYQAATASPECLRAALEACQDVEGIGEAGSLLYLEPRD